MLFTVLLTALTATSGEDTHYSKGEGHLLRGVSLLPSVLASSGSQEEGTSLTWTGGHTKGEGERERQFKVMPFWKMTGETYCSFSTTASPI